MFVASNAIKFTFDYMSSETFNPTQNLRYDIPASIVVFLVALPLCLGVALASGVPLFSGIIAGAVGGILIGLLSKSALSVSGPAAGLTVLVLAAVQRFPGAFDTFLLTVFLAGVFQVLMGVCRAGLIADFIPASVIRGMLAAIGIILILKQIPHALGRDKDYEGDFSFWQVDGENTFTEIWKAFDDAFTPGAIAISVTSILFLLLWDATAKRRTGWLKMVPGPLIVVVFGVMANLLFQRYSPWLTITQEHLVSLPVPASAQDFLGQFKFLSFREIMNPDVWTTAITLGLVASVETLLSIEAVDRLDPFKRVSPTNRELMAQGAGNMLCGLIGGMPVTSVIVRSSANVSSGARTQASTIIHGLMLLVCAAFFASIMNLIPLSALAAILLTTGYKLTKPALFTKEYTKGWAHIIPFVVTILAILRTDLLIGVLIGLIVGAVFIVFENYRSSVLYASDGNNYLVKIKKDLSFLHKSEIKQVLNNIPDNSVVIIDLSKVNFVDLDNIETIRDFMENAAYRGVKVEIYSLDGQRIRKLLPQNNFAMGTANNE
jgi:MFS superfamily sulfate permease-like transporter